MHEFASLEETEASLAALAARSPGPLAVRLPRQAGMKEQRYAHLLSGEVQVPPPLAPVHAEAAAPAARAGDERLAKLEGEAAALRAEVAELRRELGELRKLLE
jgi:uncharacterized protein YceH (UPF0502 family)